MRSLYFVVLINKKGEDKVRTFVLKKWVYDNLAYLTESLNGEDREVISITCHPKQVCEKICKACNETFKEENRLWEE